VNVRDIEGWVFSFSYGDLDVYNRDCHYRAYHYDSGELILMYSLNRLPDQTEQNS